MTGSSAGQCTGPHASVERLRAKKVIGTICYRPDTRQASPICRIFQGVSRINSLVRQGTDGFNPVTNKGVDMSFFQSVAAAASIAVFGLVASAAGAEVIGDAAEGERVFRKCAACHQVGKDARHRIGPSLNGIFDRQAGTVDGFDNYSPGLVRAGADGLVWTLDKLDAYLENPKALVSGTRMNFRGLKDAEERSDVLAYLRAYSASPQNIPEASPTALPSEVELPPEILAIVGDRDYGEYLASECQTCHQRDGSDKGIPSITGWPQEDFVVAMHAYKRKVRPHAVMQSYAGRLTDEEIAALAAYFNEL